MNHEDIYYFDTYKKNGKITKEYSDNCQNLKNRILNCEVKNFTILDLFYKKFDVIYNGINLGAYYFDYSCTADMWIGLIYRNL